MCLSWWSLCKVYGKGYGWVHEVKYDGYYVKGCGWIDEVKYDGYYDWWIWTAGFKQVVPNKYKGVYYF